MPSHSISLYNKTLNIVTKSSSHVRSFLWTSCLDLTWLTICCFHFPWKIFQLSCEGDSLGIWHSSVPETLLTFCVGRSRVFPVFGRHVVTMLWLIPFTHWNLGASHDFKENRATSKSLCNSWASHPYPYNGKNSNHLEIVRMTHFHRLQCESPQAQWHLWFQLWVMCGFIQQPAFCRISGYQVAIFHIVGWLWLRFSLKSFRMLLIWAKNLIHQIQSGSFRGLSLHSQFGVRSG